MYRIIGFIFLFLICHSVSGETDEKYSVAVGNANGSRVIYRYVSVIPKSEVKSRFPWLVVVSWKYAPKDGGGMPDDDAYQSMSNLEDALEEAINGRNLGTDVYVRTGGGLREMGYYISSREEFTQSINNKLKDHPQYPISIEFFSDPEWSDYRTLLSKVGGG